MSSKLGSWLSEESKKLQDELNAKYIASVLTEEDVTEFCEKGRFTERVAFLQSEYGAFEIAPDGSVTMGIAIPEYISIDEEEAGEEDSSLSPEELMRQFVNEFEGPCPESSDEVISRFFGFKEYDEAGWYELRQGRRARMDELRRASYYRACRDMRWFVEHNEAELERLVRETWLRNLTQAEALFADAAYVEAKEHLASRAGTK